MGKRRGGRSKRSRAARRSDVHAVVKTKGVVALGPAQVKEVEQQGFERGVAEATARGDAKRAAAVATVARRAEQQKRSARSKISLLERRLRAERKKSANVLAAETERRKKQEQEERRRNEWSPDQRRRHKLQREIEKERAKEMRRRRCSAHVDRRNAMRQGGRR
mmetsp:Transcript_6722/g.12001  ORF Transcript_6722/g.12001 Transcript_6722/m.12001 type:complete len:164 (+) Transcript_6722:225-716(+)